VPRLRDGELDLALLFEFPSARDSLGAGLDRCALFDDPLHVALPAEHPLARKPQLALEELHDAAWIQTSAASPCARHVVRMCHAAGFEPQVSFESDDYETVQGLVAAGVGVALVPRLALSRVREDIVVRALSADAPVRRIFAATAAGAGTAPAAVAMREILLDVAGRYEREAVAAAT